MPSSIKKSTWTKTLLVLIILIIALPILIYSYTKIRNTSLLNEVKSSVQDEYDKIQLPGLEFEDKYVYGSECSYDYKVGATRCSIDYTKYYVTNENVVDEFLRVDKYLTDLGWNYWSSAPDNREKIEYMLEGGFPPFEIYVKEAPYPLEVHMEFYGDRDREFSNEKVIELLDHYSDEGKSVYSISISSDII